eukprot:5700634-Amphidinium_carterae.1
MGWVLPRVPQMCPIGTNPHVTRCEEEMVNVAKHSAVRAGVAQKLLEADAEDYAKGEYLVPQALIEAPSGNKVTRC